MAGNGRLAQVAGTEQGTWPVLNYLAIVWLGIILFLIIEIAEKFLIPWHASRRSTASVGAV